MASIDHADIVETLGGSENLFSFIVFPTFKVEDVSGLILLGDSSWLPFAILLLSCNGPGNK